MLKIFLITVIIISCQLFKMGCPPPPPPGWAGRSRRRRLWQACSGCTSWSASPCWSTWSRAVCHSVDSGASWWWDQTWPRENVRIWLSWSISSYHALLTTLSLPPPGFLWQQVQQSDERWSVDELEISSNFTWTTIVWWPLDDWRCSLQPCSVFLELLLSSPEIYKYHQNPRKYFCQKTI